MTWREAAQDAGLQLELNDSETSVSRTMCLISVAIIVNRGVSFNYHAIHAKRVTIMPKDIQLDRRIRAERA